LRRFVLVHGSPPVLLPLPRPAALPASGRLPRPHPPRPLGGGRRAGRPPADHHPGRGRAGAAPTLTSWNSPCLLQPVPPSPVPCGQPCSPVRSCCSPPSASPYRPPPPTSRRRSAGPRPRRTPPGPDRKSTRLNSSHVKI